MRVIITRKRGNKTLKFIKTVKHFADALRVVGETQERWGTNITVIFQEVNND